MLVPLFYSLNYIRKYKYLCDQVYNIGLIYWKVCTNIRKRSHDTYILRFKRVKYSIKEICFQMNLVN